MIISIEKSPDGGKIPEWGLIEFQGSFELPSNDDKPIFGEYIGDINYTKDGTPFFINGQQILFGQEVKLRKPFAVISKNFEKDDCIKQYLVKAVIRKKVIFKTRPKPIIPSEVLNECGQ